MFLCIFGTLQAKFERKFNTNPIYHGRFVMKLS